VAQEGPAPVGMMAFITCLTYLVPVVGILLVVYGGKTAKVMNAVLASSAMTVLLFYPVDYSHRKFSLPAPTSKWYLTMPRSIWV